MLNKFVIGFNKSFENTRRFIDTFFDELILTIGALGSFIGILVYIFGAPLPGATIVLSSLFVVVLAIIWNS